MLFVAFLKSIPGQYKEAIKSLKHHKVPEGIEVVQFIGTFGKYDGVILFNAVNESDAAEFTIQFRDHMDVTTALACSIDDLRWTM